jgi:chromosome segregation ATPase
MSTVAEAEFNQFTENALQQFSIADSAIAKMREDYLPLKIAGVNDDSGFKAVHSARMVVKNHRVEVDKVRKALKADALEYGRKVDGEAKRITALLEPIEKHLTEEEDAYNAEKERIRTEARLKAEAEERARAEAEAARLKAEADAEAARLKAIQDAENARLKAEAEKLAEERRILEAERQKVEAEKKRLADIEAARLRKIEDERIAREAAEKARIETEQRIAREAAEAMAKAEREAEAAKAKAEAEEAARKRAEELRPDREKILWVIGAIDSIVVPALTENSTNARTEVIYALAAAQRRIREIADSLGEER